MIRKLWMMLLAVMLVIAPVSLMADTTAEFPVEDIAGLENAEAGAPEGGEATEASLPDDAVADTAVAVLLAISGLFGDNNIVATIWKWVLVAASLIGTATMLVELLVKVLKATPSKDDDKYIPVLKKGLNWVTWILNAIARNDAARSKGST